MKKAFGFVLVAASLLLVSGAQAQDLHLKAGIPFEFVVGDARYPAGSYEIQSLSPNGGAVIFRTEGKAGMSVLHTCGAAAPVSNTQLVFKRVGGEYFLYRIWMAGNSEGGELTQPKEETRLARNEKSQQVIIAANLVK